MEAIGQLTGGLAHDFNNLLTIISGNLEMLEMRVTDPKAQILLQEAQGATDDGAKLTGQLLAFGRRQPLNPRLTDLGQLVSSFSELIRRTIGDRVELRTTIRGGGNEGLVDGPQLQNALLNLALNARDAMPSGGLLTIEVNRVHLDFDYAQMYPQLRAGDYVLIAVTDTGTGMTDEVKQRAFEPFFTTKPPGLGTGLGLSQVHGFVKQSGGHISIYSEVGHGTSIKLYLPRSGEDTEALPPAPVRRAPSDRRHQTVLVVDDEAGVRDFASEALVELGYDVLSAGDADQAMKLIEDNGDIHILLTDVVMPGKSGRDLAEAVHRLRPAMHVLYMTGYTQNAIVHNGVLDTGTHLITKPFTVGQLSEELEALEQD